MRRFLKAWKQRGYDRRFGSRVVNYADDFVILCRRDATGALSKARSILTRIGLTINETKTRICYAPTDSFDFLGYTFGTRYSFGSGRKYLAAYPSGKSVRRLRATLRRMIGTHMSWQSEEQLVRNVNRVMHGWMNYFRYGTVWKTYVQMERFLQRRVRDWLVHKHRLGTRGECRYPATYLYETMGLVNPCVLLKLRKPSG